MWTHLLLSRNVIFNMINVHVWWLCVLVCAAWAGEETSDWQRLELPAEHVPYYFTNNPDLEKQCEQDPKCPFKEYVNSGRCWGHEEPCPEELRMLNPECPQDVSRGWARNKEEQMSKFWQQSDFGYIRGKMETLTTLCQGTEPEDSHLECVEHTLMCRSRNLYIDFSKVDFSKSRNRYQEDLVAQGAQIGGKCQLDDRKFMSMLDHKSPLQSWAAELSEFSSIEFQPTEKKHCDQIFDKPTIFMKLDAGVNMYHHFCDFVNLYVTQHANNSFDRDVQIIMWDTSVLQYGDLFHVTWQAFSKHPIIHLKTLQGKKVCFKDAVFAFLPRMRYGLYYNMPLIPGCHSSSLFRAFSQHVLHRMGITQEGPLEDKIRVTLLRRNTKYRNIMNEKELIEALKNIPEYEVNVVEYNHQMTFEEQLQHTANSDMFMGMHGAGLTHLLFQPDWGAFFEIYNCEDQHCYSDLARLRGVLYLTWENIDKLIQEDEGHHPSLGAHAKFTNYAFDVEEFLRMVAKGVKHVRDHAAFQYAWERKYGRPYPKDRLKQARKDEL